MRSVYANINICEFYSNIFWSVFLQYFVCISTPRHCLALISLRPITALKTLVLDHVMSVSCGTYAKELEICTIMKLVCFQQTLSNLFYTFLLEAEIKRERRIISVTCICIVHVLDVWLLWVQRVSPQYRSDSPLAICVGGDLPWCLYFTLAVVVVAGYSDNKR